MEIETEGCTLLFVTVYTTTVVRGMDLSKTSKKVEESVAPMGERVCHCSFFLPRQSHPYHPRQLTRHKEEKKKEKE